MAAGYAMTRHELVAAIPAGAEPEPRSEGEAEWPFAEALKRLADPNGLADALRPGSSRFFRGYRRWRQELAAKPKGKLRKLLDASHLSSAPSLLAGGVRTVVVSPVRKVLSAPVAVAGGVGTKVYLWASGLRGGD
jgi:hypothetical protein